MTLRTIRLMIPVAVLTAVLAGCGNEAESGAAASDPAQEVARPSTSDGAFTLAPSDKEAPDTRLVDNPYYSLRVPSSFQSKPGLSKKAPSEFLEAPQVDAARPVRLYLVVDKEPRSDALEQSYVAEITAQGKGVKVERSEISWPGAEKAVLMRIERPGGADPVARASAAGPSASGGYDGPMTSIQIFAQVNPQLIVNVVAYAPSAEMETSGLMDALRSFRPKAG